MELVQRAEDQTASVSWMSLGTVLPMSSGILQYVGLGDVPKARNGGMFQKL